MSFELYGRDLRVHGRTRRAFAASLVTHVLILTTLLIAASRHVEPPTITEVSWLEPKELEAPVPPPVVPSAPVVVPPAPAMPKPVSAPPAAVESPASRPVPPPSRSDRPLPAGHTQADEAPGASGITAAPASSGAKGRVAGARVAQDLAQTRARIDNVLAGLSATVPAGGASSGGGGNRQVDDRFAVAGGRGSGAAASADGDLRGTGLGAVGAGTGAGGGQGPGRGVRRLGVAMDESGVETSGGGADSSGRDSRSLMAVVQRYVAGIKFCYDNALKKLPALAGKVTIQMDITPAGEVTNLSVVDDSMGNAALQRCILSQVEGWRFPPVAAATVRFTLPLVCTPPHDLAP